MRSLHRGGLTTALLTAAVAACGQATGQAGASVSPAPRPAAASASSDLEAIARARADSARHRYTAADVRFVSGMIGHHAQAIVMARMASSHGASPALRTLAGRIINAQQDEIAIMQQWLRDRGQPVPDPAATPHVHGSTNGMQHDMRMPGMLTEEQLQQLDAARGKEFDRLFLVDMIQHHRGAVTMVQELLNNPGAGQDDTVFKLAADINVDQTTEIDRMEKMLAALLLGISP